MNDQQPTPDPARSFGSVAEAYQRGRPSYPVEAVQWLLGPDPRIVLELGAGTGKLTAQMVRQGHAVHACDPDAAMLEVLTRVVPDASVKVASAEEIPANDDSVDVVVVAQAFHWFDHARALPEIARVLRPGGRIALIWNSPDRRIPWVRRLGDLIGHHDQNVTSAERIAECGLFAPTESTTFKSWQDINRATIVDLALSRSTIASLPPEAQSAKLAEVVAFYDDFGRGMDGMQVPYQVHCFSAKLLDPNAQAAGEADVDGQDPAGPRTPAPPAVSILTADGTSDMLLIDFK